MMLCPWISYRLCRTHDVTLSVDPVSTECRIATLSNSQLNDLETDLDAKEATLSRCSHDDGIESAFLTTTGYEYDNATLALKCTKPVYVASRTRNSRRSSQISYNFVLSMKLFYANNRTSFVLHVCIFR
ncbi:hypothetical protein HT594_00125 [Phenacoccus solenopsis nudivirus]|nr:hypothetical protein HT594_00125 [Phenacoccus solenopsis nudivirus]